MTDVKIKIKTLTLILEIIFNFVKYYTESDNKIDENFRWKKLCLSL